MKYYSIKEMVDKWGISRRRIQKLCTENRISGAIKIGNMWAIPENVNKPDDGRLKLDIDSKIKNEKIVIERYWAMPNKKTFSIKPIKDLLFEEISDGLWIDPFANTNKLAKITNDLSKEFDTDYHLDALDFLKMFDSNSVDGILYDPPYSPRQVSECYNNVGFNVTWDTTKASFWGNHKKEISRILKKNGKVITFGWNSGGIGMSNGFEIKRILLVPHGGWHNDTICTVEIKKRNIKRNLGNNSKVIYKNTKKDLSISDKKLIDKLTELPIDYWDFKNYDTKEFTHGLHSYPAMMVCPISKNIISIVKEIKPIQTLFDPYAGSGTVLVEGMVSEIEQVCGNDINPLALFLTKVKTTPINTNLLQEICSNLKVLINDKFIEKESIIKNSNEIISNNYGYDLTAKKGWGDKAPEILLNYLNDNNYRLDIPNFKNLGFWFKPNVIIELSIIKNEITKIKDKNIKDFIFVAFSEILRLVSNRRNGEFKMYRMAVTKLINHNPNVLDLFYKILDRNIIKMNSFIENLNQLDTKSAVTIYNNNSCELLDVPDNYFDLIITSPPYGDSRTTVAYGEYSRLSLQWIDLFNLENKEIMSVDKTLMGGKKYRNGFDYQIPSEILKTSLNKIAELDIQRAGDVYSFYEDLENSIKAISKKTKIGGYHFWVVGNRTVKNEKLATDRIIVEIASKYELVEIYDIGRNIPNKVMPSKNSPTNISGEKLSTMCNEHILVLKKI